MFLEVRRRPADLLADVAHKPVRPHLPAVAGGQVLVVRNVVLFESVLPLKCLATDVAQEGPVVLVHVLDVAQEVLPTHSLVVTLWAGVNHHHLGGGVGAAVPLECIVPAGLVLTLGTLKHVIGL